MKYLDIIDLEQKIEIMDIGAAAIQLTARVPAVNVNANFQKMVVCSLCVPTTN